MKQLPSRIVTRPSHTVHRDLPRHPADVEILIEDGAERVGRAHLVYGPPDRLIPWLRSIYAYGMADHLEEESRNPVGLIEYVEVHPAYRGKGLGRRLMREAIALLVKKRVKVVYLQASSSVGGVSEDVLVRLYEGLGFENLGPLSDVSGDPLMALELTGEEGAGLGNSARAPIAPVLYHGTLLESVPAILERGIERGEGWGGAGTSGVFLSKTPEGALYWAKIAYQRDRGERMEIYHFDREHGQEADRLLAVLTVQVPDDQVGLLRADEEQFEDVGADFPADDWRQSLEKIGDARFEGEVPPAWIRDVIPPSAIERPSSRKRPGKEGGKA
jgi:GNAT superfamily N-acetyltransferase